VKQVQLALGHESASTTLDTYTHLWPTEDDKARSAIQKFLAVSPTCQVQSVAEQNPRSESNSA
jgi:hypothetical protein